jgi:hypothetical protein
MSSNTNTGGVSIFTVLTLIFVVLKLCGVINWSWWLVFLPTLIPLGILAIVLVLFALFFTVACIVQKV